jgi:hypothetical protein
MIDELNTISTDLNLWEKTKNHAVKCIETYIVESFSLDYPIHSKVTIDDFVLTKKNQSLIFWATGSKTYVLRTTYDITLQNKIGDINGYYSMDINENGDIIDDWLVLK